MNMMLISVLQISILAKLSTPSKNLYLKVSVKRSVPRENHRPVASHWQTLSHNVVSSTPRLIGIWTV